MRSLFFVLLPALTAVVNPFLRRVDSRLVDVLSTVVLLAGLCAVLFFPLADGSDSLSVLMLLAVYLIAFLVSLFSVFFVQEERSRGTFFSLILVCAAGMAGVVTTRDFFTLYVFLEVVAVSSFAMIAFAGDPAGTEGALKYLFLSAVASALILLGVAGLLLATGGVSFPHLSGGIAKAGVLLAASLLACGFMIKAGLIPFHGWVPDAYESAPAPVSALLAGIVTKVAGVYALIRLGSLLGLSVPDGPYAAIGKALMFFGALSIVVGAVAAMTQHDFKRILAYSSISQVGYIVLAAGTGTPLALAGAVFHLFNHATFKVTLFLNGAAIEKATGTRDMTRLGGLGSRMPWTAGTSVVAFLSTAGIPPLSGFWSKLVIIVALWQAGSHGYAALAILSSVLTLAYFLILQRKVFFGDTVPLTRDAQEVCPGMLAPVVLAAALMILVGLYFPTVLEPFLGGDL
ncbi:MAG: proton-conducting transporter membrane subunit [Elusimicrobiota bacterium]